MGGHHGGAEQHARDALCDPTPPGEGLEEQSRGRLADGDSPRRRPLDAAGAITHIVSPKEGRVKGWQFTDWGDEFEVDVPLERANPDDPGQVPAPFSGVVTLTVAAGDTVAVGDQVATIEAMKMEASITSPVAGTVQQVALQQAQTVEGGDLLLVVTPS